MIHSNKLSLGEVLLLVATVVFQSVAVYLGNKEIDISTGGEPTTSKQAVVGNKGGVL